VFSANFEAKNIKQVYSLPHKPTSNGGIERYNQSLKTLLEKYRMQSGRKDYVPVLQKAVKTLNSQVNRITKKIPDKVIQNDPNIAVEVFNNIVNQPNRARNRVDKQVFVPGELVRIYMNTEKSALRWSKTPYRIKEVYIQNDKGGYKKTVYDVETLAGELLTERFSNDQLTKYYSVRKEYQMKDRNEIYIVQRLLRPCIYKQGNVTKPGVIVSWMNYDKPTPEPIASINADVPKMTKLFLTEFQPKFVRPDNAEVDPRSNQNIPGLKGSYMDKNLSKPLLINK
jgi:hypothetical protein